MKDIIDDQPKNAKQIFCELWNRTLMSKGQQPLDADTLAMIYYDLEHYQLNDIIRALSRYRRNPDQGMYNLSVAMVVKMIEGDSESASIVAWTDADTIIRRLGPRPDIICKDRIVMKVIQTLGGVEKPGLLNDFEYSEYSRNFKKLYQHYRINGAESCPEILLGYDNPIRRAAGLPEIKPRMIGFEEIEKPQLKSIPRTYAQIENSKSVSPDEAKESLKNFLSSMGISFGKKEKVS